MRIPKRYGQSKSNKCPFCGVEAVFQNSQGVPVCNKHKELNLDDLRCVCGESLELRTGKFGPYFHCMNCGNMNFRKCLEVNEGRINKKKDSELKSKKKFQETKSKIVNEQRPKEIVVRSDELDFMFE